MARLAWAAIVLAAVLTGCSSTPASPSPASPVTSTGPATSLTTTSTTPAETTATTTGLTTEPSTPKTSSTEPSTTETSSPGTAPADNAVVINDVVYKGDPARGESDEYVEIQNWQTIPVDLTGWILKNLHRGDATFTFTSYMLRPGKTIRVYTNEVHPEWGGFSFGSETPIWDNAESNTAILYDAGGLEISRRTY